MLARLTRPHIFILRLTASLSRNVTRERGRKTLLFINWAELSPSGGSKLFYRDIVEDNSCHKRDAEENKARIAQLMLFPLLSAFIREKGPPRAYKLGICTVCRGRSCSAPTSLMHYFPLKRLKARINRAHVLFGALKRVGGALKSSL